MILSNLMMFRWTDIGTYVLATADFHWELQHILEEEVDYRFEASNLRRMRKTLRRHHIFVPRVFDQYITRHVLVMEFVEGAPIADYLRLTKTDPAGCRNNAEPVLLARRLALSMLRQHLKTTYPTEICILEISSCCAIAASCSLISARSALSSVNISRNSVSPSDPWPISTTTRQRI